MLWADFGEPMISREPKRWNLEHEDRIWVAPGSTLQIRIPLSAPLPDGAILTARATEHNWPYGITPNTEAGPRDWPAAVDEPSIFTTEGLNLHLDIPWSHIAYWGRGRRMNMSIRVAHGSVSWEIGHCQITIAEGS